MEVDGNLRQQLLIPAGHEDNVLVTVPLEQLPDEVEEIIEVLGAELAPISVWLDVAKAYLQRGQVDQYLVLLRQVVGEQVLEHYGERAKFGRIQAFCALAQYSITLARTEQDITKRNQLLNEASRELARAQHEDENEQLVHLGFGLLEIAKGHGTMASAALAKAKKKKCNGQTNVAADIALAQVHFQQEKYESALKSFVDAFRAHPSGPLSIRLGIAACHFKLHNYSVAQAAYERVLQLDPDNAEALAGLAALNFAAADPRIGVPSGLANLQRAYALDPTSAPVLNALSTFALVRGDYATSIDLAEAALQSAETLDMRGACLCSMARAHHAQGSLDQAHSYYGQANRLNDKSPLSHYGLAQMLLQQGEIKNAMTKLETVLGLVNSNVDALTLLGQLYPQMPSKTGKRTLRVKDAARKHGNNPIIQEMLGEVLAPNEPAKALEAYKAAISLQRARVERETQAAAEAHAETAPVPVRLLNNAAVLYYRCSQLDTARECVQQALDSTAAGADPEMPAAAVLTLRYNLARTQEACGDSKPARAGYEAILADNPQYIDCYLRLSSIMRARGQYAAAERLATDAMAIEGGHEDALAMMALTHVKTKEWSKAKSYLDKLLKGEGGKIGHTNDVYGNVLMGNLHLSSAPSEVRGKGANKKELKQKQLQHWASSAKYFKAALELEPGNIYAANGLGAICAEMGQLDAARNIFGLLRESAALAGGVLQVPDVWVNMGIMYLTNKQASFSHTRYPKNITVANAGRPSRSILLSSVLAAVSRCTEELRRLVWVNLGIMYLAIGQSAEAARMFSTALSKFYNNKEKTVLLYLARALYDQGKNHEAKRTLLKALHLVPNDHQLLFNVALCMQNYAVALLRKPRDQGDPKRLEEFTSAKIELTQATQFFDRLRKLGSKRTGIASEILKLHVDFCRDTSKRAHKHYQSAMEEQKQTEATHRLQATKMAVKNKEKSMKEHMAEQAARLKKQELEALAKSHHEREKGLQEKWRHADAMTKSKPRKPAKQEAMEVAEPEVGLFGEDDDSSDEEYDASVAAADEAMAEKDEQDIKARGYNSDDERGTADRPDLDASPERSRLKRKTDVEDAPAATLAGTGLESDDEDDMAEPGHADAAGDELAEVEAPTKRARVLLDDSDED